MFSSLTSGQVAVKQKSNASCLRPYLSQSAQGSELLLANMGPKFCTFIFSGRIKNAIIIKQAKNRIEILKMWSSRSCRDLGAGNPTAYWEMASRKIQMYPAQTKRLLNNDYYGGCRHHGSQQPYVVCSQNKVGGAGKYRGKWEPIGLAGMCALSMSIGVGAQVINFAGTDTEGVNKLDEIDHI